MSLKQDHLERIFSGKTETNDPVLKNIFIDRFEDYAWCTFHGSDFSNLKTEQLLDFLMKFDLRGAVLFLRTKEGANNASVTFLGDVPEGDYTVHENGLKFILKFRNTAHPGLFLDQSPLRKWLKQNSSGKRVLNLFSYTGSLSVAAAAGGATEVVSVDLSKAYQNWAKQNFELNSLKVNDHFFWTGDVFEFLKRLQKKKEYFDIIISDPPSFSRADGKVFSTSKDLVKLHREIVKLLLPEGLLVTSINSENVSTAQFKAEVAQALRMEKVSFKEVMSISAHSSFPKSHPLKGLILKRTS